MYLLVLTLVLSAYLPTSEGACRTGFELLGEVISQSEKQLEVISSSSAKSCPACDTEFGCFNTLLDQFKMDLADLGTLKSSVIDSYLHSKCSWAAHCEQASVLLRQDPGVPSDCPSVKGKTLYVEPDSTVLTQKVTSSNTDNLPFSNILGIDCNLREDLLIHASSETLEVIESDGDGTNLNFLFQN